MRFPKLPQPTVERYLERIGEPEVAQSLDALERLQRAHLTRIPFENLDVWRRIPTSLSPVDAVDKIVNRGRGGWCFEVNSAFGSLLSSVGFDVTGMAALVLSGDVSPGPDHLTLRVQLDRPYLVDVGFGDSFIRPIPLDDPGPHNGGAGTFAIDSTVVYSLEDGHREDQYRFFPASSMKDFETARHYLQTDPGSLWHQKPFATRLIDGGPDRVTLLSDRLKIRRDGQWDEETVHEDSWLDHLAQWFDLRI